ncbi:MAG: RsiV family protein, partial [Pyrinomonadaceae bacterium]
KEAGPDESLFDDATIEEGAAAKEDNYGSWNITRKGLLITFDAYQVGPYAAGPQWVVVPYSALKEIIRADGPLAPFVK